MSQTRYPRHSCLCPHRSQFLRTDARLHGWGIIFTKDSGILHPLKDLLCPCNCKDTRGLGMKEVYVMLLQISRRLGGVLMSPSTCSGQALCLILESQVSKTVSK